MNSMKAFFCSRSHITSEDSFLAQNGDTALVFASSRGCSVTVSLLRQADAKMDHPEEEVRKTSRLLTTRTGHEEIPHVEISGKKISRRGVMYL
jgi:hypothetical protein